MSYGKLPKPGFAAQDNRMGLGYTFDQALAWLKAHKKITRHGWNGAGMYIYLVDERYSAVDPHDDETSRLVGQYAEGELIVFTQRIDMRYANATFGTWTPTHDDLLADDWRILQ